MKWIVNWLLQPLKLSFDLGGGGGGSSDSAGSEASAAATKQLAGISQEQWDWYKNNYLPAATQAANNSDATANQTQNYYDNQYIPQAEQIQQGLVSQSQNSQASNNGIAYGQKNLSDTDAAQASNMYNESGILNSANNNIYVGTLGEMKAQADQTGGVADQEWQAMLARGDVDQQFGNANQSLVAKMQQAGIGGNSGQMLAVQSQSAATQAAADAAAMTKARDAAKQLGWTYKSQVANQASNLGTLAQGASAAGTAASGASSSAAGTASSASNSAVANATAPLTGLGTVAAGYQGAQSAAGIPLANEGAVASGINGGASSAAGAAGSAGNIAGQQAAAAAQQSQANASGTGSLIGALGGIATAAILA